MINTQERAAVDRRRGPDPRLFRACRRRGGCRRPARGHDGGAGRSRVPPTSRGGRRRGWRPDRPALPTAGPARHARRPPRPGQDLGRAGGADRGAPGAGGRPASDRALPARSGRPAHPATRFRAGAAALGGAGAGAVRPAERHGGQGTAEAHVDDRTESAEATAAPARGLDRADTDPRATQRSTADPGEQHAPDDRAEDVAAGTARPRPSAPLRPDPLGGQTRSPRDTMARISGAFAT